MNRGLGQVEHEPHVESLRGLSDIALVHDRVVQI